MTKTILLKTLTDESNKFIHDNSDLYSKCDCGQYECNWCSRDSVTAEQIRILEEYQSQLKVIKETEQLILKNILH